MSSYVVPTYCVFLYVNIVDRRIMICSDGLRGNVLLPSWLEVHQLLYLHITMLELHALHILYFLNVVYDKRTILIISNILPNVTLPPLKHNYAVLTGEGSRKCS